MNLTPTSQDYVKAIYFLQQVEAPVSNGRLAAHFAISAPAITEMLKKLSAMDLVMYHARAGARLTDKGERIALEMIRHHRLLELYLVTALGMDWDEVHAEAEILEHVLSESLEERIAAFLGHPEFDPHGAPIPARDGSLPERAMQPLASLAPGAIARVVQVDGGDAARLRYLGSLGLVPQAMVEIVCQEPFDGPLTLRVGQAADPSIIDARLATRIFVQPCSS